MLFKKPNIKYTEMAMWVDAHAYEDDCDESLMYEYIYHIFCMLARKRKFFNQTHHIDDYAANAASKVVMRYKNKKQFGDNPTLSKVKSVLNYCKNVSYPLKVQYEQEFYAQNYQQGDVEDIQDIQSLHDVLVDVVNPIASVDFSQSVETLDRCLRDFIKTIPCETEVYRNNLYISCMLTLIDSITLSRRDSDYIDYKMSNQKLTIELLNKVYANNRYRKPILFHLDSNDSNLVLVVVNEMRHLISKVLSESLHSNEHADSVMKSLLASAIDRDSAEYDSYWGE